jgi:hypothetical protein
MHAYFGISGNFERLATLRNHVARIWRKWLSRRSNERSRVDDFRVCCANRGSDSSNGVAFNEDVASHEVADILVHADDGATLCVCPKRRTR